MSMAIARKPGTRQRRRGVGRPRGGDARLRAKLVDAALAHFARVGIRGTSLRAIAEAAGVTPAMLHYYFGDKQELTLAVVEEKLLPAAASVRARIESIGDDPAEIAEAFVNGIGDVIASHPWFPALWVREVLCEGGALRDAMFKRVVPQLPQLLAQRFAIARAQGRLAPDLDPRLMVVSLVGLTLFPAAGAPIWTRMFDSADLDGAALRRHALALLEHGMGASRHAARQRKRQSR
jgi:TetR/AcrR family transcriptional regulator